MTSTVAYPYTFDTMSRIGNDNPAIDQRNIQNINEANYNLENFYPACPMSTAIDFALSQPNVFYKGSHEGGVKGCAIEANNDLKYCLSAGSVFQLILRCSTSSVICP